MAARKRGARKGTKKAAKKSAKKGHVPLAILKKRHKELGALIARREKTER